jgi:hypothetical protein
MPLTNGHFFLQLRCSFFFCAEEDGSVQGHWWPLEEEEGRLQIANESGEMCGSCQLMGAIEARTQTLSGRTVAAEMWRGQQGRPRWRGWRGWRGCSVEAAEHPALASLSRSQTHPHSKHSGSSPRDAVRRPEQLTLALSTCRHSSPKQKDEEDEE